MAVVPIVPTKLSRGSHKWVWETLLNGDTGGPLDPDGGGSTFADKTVHVKGTFGVGGNVIIEGSNDGVTWVTLTDPQGTALNTITTETLEAILENPLYIRPRVSAGDGTTDLDVILAGRAILQLR
ncbi:hypothetical protein LCGC14_3052050 [marine sediment metagenome]|uniref:Uncharacterized protein n=1 Tax=marine sediment metagenome TaxID=412755 RepID=A0A0F8YUA4_9ZZZZ